MIVEPPATLATWCAVGREDIVGVCCGAAWRLHIVVAVVQVYGLVSGRVEAVIVVDGTRALD